MAPGAILDAPPEVTEAIIKIVNDRAAQEKRLDHGNK